MSEECMPRSRAHDLLGAGLGLFCVLMLVLTPWQVDLDVPYAFYKGPLLMPLMVLSMGTLASIPFWKRLLKPLPGSEWRLDGQGPPTRPAVMLLMGGLYPVLIMYVGLEIATFTVLGAELRYLGIKKPVLLLGIPTAITLIFWLVFKLLLDVFFPTPEVLYWFGG